MTADASIQLATALEDLPGVPARVVKLLAKEGIATVSDVLWQLPFRHEDRRRAEDTVFQPSETPVCHRVRVTKTSQKFFGRRRGAGMFDAMVEPEGGAALGQGLTLRWWNMPYMSKAIAEDQVLFVHGRIKDQKGRLVMAHPEYEILGEGEEELEGGGPTVHTGRITPIYRLKGGLTQKALRVAAWEVVQRVGEDFVGDLLPKPSSKGEFAGWNRCRALKAIHFPADEAELETAGRYLALEEFFGYQLRVVHRRRDFIDSGGRSHAGTGELVSEFEQALPFDLTPAQRRCVEEIRADMGSPRPMNRLLHGDVGSGKTVVAFLSMLRAVESGSQAALMAPTQILAEQHFQNARKWFEPLGIRVGLKTGHRREDGSGLELWSGEASSEAPEVLIGTHALLHDRDLVRNLGLVVIDEQHKFGVAQRARLIEKGRTPDVLVMTATPIPRTLTLTIYGDLDVSTIDERPKARGKVITRIRSAAKVKEAAKFLREQLEEGRQAYLVYPLIEDSEKLDVKAATSGCEEWRKLLEPHSVDLLHGRMSAEEKDDVMRRFRNADVGALISTTVIEVGVDVPNATTMYIHAAERFGLAQLHQLRGRIGRGSHTSYCVLFVKDKDEEAKARLAILEETHDGFKVAEEDLKRRGPGDVLGRAQSGEAPLRFGAYLADTRLVRMARSLAEKTLDEDPALTSPRFDMIRGFVLNSSSEDSRLQ